MSFLFDSQKPMLVAMVQEATVAGAIDVIMNAHYDGAEAFGIQLEDLELKYRNLTDLKKIFAACMGKPIYITSYRVRNSAGLSDEECLELLLLGAEAGADLCDIMGDTFDHQPHELTFDAQAVERQKEYIDRIHAMGKQVLISTHTHAYLDAETISRYAAAQKERGADVVKIVNFAGDRQQLRDNMDMVFRLQRELEGMPFLFLANGACSRPLRQTGPLFGVCMYLCVVQHKPGYSKEQPVLRSMKQIRDNLMFLTKND